MRERPIILSGDDVRSIRRGSNLLTFRAPVKFPKRVCYNWGIVGAEQAYAYGGKHKDGNLYSFLVAGDQGYAEVPSPYGVVGDRLWVKESWAALPNICRDTYPGPC